jgi:microcystin-dependent protein
MSLNDKKIILLKKLHPSNFIINIENIPEEKEKTIYELFEEFKSSINTIDYLPIGSIIIYSSNIIPNNWLKCDGSQLLVNDYSNLYAIIGNLYGGDNYLFNLPDLKGNTVIGVGNKYYLANKGGEELHVLTIDELPYHSITGKTNISGNHNHNELTSLNGEHTHVTNSNNYGLIHKSTGNNNTVNNLSLKSGIDLPDLLTTPTQLEINNSGNHTHSINYDGNHEHSFISNPIGSNIPHNIMQPYIVMNYLIKYK